MLLLLLCSLLLQNIETNNNDIKWRRTPPLSRSKTLPDLLYQDQDVPLPTFHKGKVTSQAARHLSINLNCSSI
jgi:hypothetical protein